ncbi:putative bifunctional diguanylate cyclase/phosphodiesterase [Alginatibacterium sediminis]|nr:bifunctional diguanylate cyclase/phosphodiesterase [Alginatibacterium sediminis]
MTLNEMVLQDLMFPTLVIATDGQKAFNSPFLELSDFEPSYILDSSLNQLVRVAPSKADGDPVDIDVILEQAKAQLSPIVFEGEIVDANFFPITCKISCCFAQSPQPHWKLQFHLISNKSVDVVTHLPNGWAFAYKAGHYFSDAKNMPNNLALLVVNIDNFATINYRYGFSVGDKYLTAFGLRLKEKARDLGLTVRFSNARFGVLVDKLGDRSAQQAKSEMLAFCEQLCQLSVTGLEIDKRYTIIKSLSLGLCIHEPDFDNHLQLELNADTAMLRAARFSHSSYELADSKRSEQFYNRKIIIDELPQAIENNLFELRYQPQYQLHDGRLIGFEALSRWQHSQQGHVSPILFIEVAEELGMHFEFDLMVVGNVCRQINYWIQLGLDPVRVSVNISFKTLEMSTFVHRVCQILRELKCPTKFLEFEITETSDAKNLETLSENIQALVDLGIRIAIDDFGTGYSSLSLIRGYYKSIDTLKLDRSLIEDITGNQTAKRFAQHIVDLGKVLDLTILAEGVETAEQKHLLNEMGCQYAQGYFFDRPLDIVATEKLLRAQR